MPEKKKYPDPIVGEDPAAIDPDDVKNAQEQTKEDVKASEFINEEVGARAVQRPSTEPHFLKDMGEAKDVSPVDPVEDVGPARSVLVQAGDGTASILPAQPHPESGGAVSR